MNNFCHVICFLSPSFLFLHDPGQESTCRLFIQLPAETRNTEVTVISYLNVMQTLDLEMGD